MSQVEYDLAAFQRAKFVGREGALMELHVNGELAPDAALTALVRAVNIANDLLAAEEAAGHGLYALVKYVTRGPNGPIASFKECEPAAALRLFLETLSAALQARGISGKLVPLPPEQLDRWFDNNSFSSLTAMFLLSVDRVAAMATYDTYAHQPDICWWVDADTSDAALGPIVDWVLEGGDMVELSYGSGRIPARHDEVRDLMRMHPTTQHRVFLRAKDGPGRMRQLRLGHFGEAMVQEYAPEVPTDRQYEQLLELLRSAGPHLTSGWLQEAATSVTGRYGLLWLTPPSHPLGRKARNAPWLLFHLEEQHVYDAYVAQVLTDSQLGRTRSLHPERWQVTPLGSGRQLVTHAEPGLWTNHGREWDPLPRKADGRGPLIVSPVPDEVLTQAREDFGDAIMTLETLERHPFVGPPERRP